MVTSFFRRNTPGLFHSAEASSIITARSILLISVFLFPCSYTSAIGRLVDRAGVRFQLDTVIWRTDLA